MADLSTMSAQELLALAKQQLQRVQTTKDAISASGGFTKEGLAKATSSLKTANQKLYPSLNETSRASVDQVVAQSKQKALDAAAQTKSIPPINLSSNDRVSNTVALSSALNKAVEVARKQRQSAELDFVGGRIPPGAISASTFGSLMSGLNRASTQFTQPLISETLAAVEADRQFIEDEKNDIRNLALSLVEQGASQEAIQGVLNAPDLNSAISMSAGVLQADAREGFEIRTIGNKLVKVDSEGNAQVIFNGGSSGSGSSTSSTSSPVSVSGLNFMDESMSDVKSEVKRMFAQDFANRIITELTDEQLRLFINDYVEASNQNRMSIEPEQYYSQWRSAAGLETEEATTGSINNPF